MTAKTPNVNTVAPLTNVGLCLALLERAVNRPQTLPGMVVFHGPSGYGKSTAAAFVRNKLNACYVECKSTWTKKALLTEILREMGVAPHKTVYEMYNQICEHLVGRILIIDEMDHIVDRKLVEVIRDIYEGSQAPMLLIGEEQLPSKLEQWERFHGRILDWQAAQPVGLADVAHLSRLYCPGLDVGEDLLIRIHDLSKGSVRRVCVNLAKVFEEARRSGMKEVCVESWGARELYTGRAPARRLS